MQLVWLDQLTSECATDARKRPPGTRPVCGAYRKCPVEVEVSESAVVVQRLLRGTTVDGNIPDSVDHYIKEETTQAKTGALNRKISARLLQNSHVQNASYGSFFALGASVFFLSLARVFGSAILDTFR